MRIGNISHGKIKCDNCGRVVGYAERYLIITEKDGAESTEKGAETRRYCVECAMKKGYGSQRVEKGDTVTTFFEEPINPVSAPPEPEETAAKEIEPVAEKEAEQEDE